MHYVSPAASVAVSPVQNLAGRRENAGVVHHQYIALSQEAGQVFDCRMHDRARPAIEVQHPRRSSVRGRFLGDELWRESEVEVADVHPRVMLLRARNAGD